MSRAILLISCPDKRGITAAVTNFIFSHQGNIIHADQHIDEQRSIFFMRVEWALEGFTLTSDQIKSTFEPIAQEYDMDWNIYQTDKVANVAIFVSKHLHCLYDVLIRQKSGQLPCQVKLIVSNHPDAKPIADEFGVAYHQFEITPENKVDQEKQELALLAENDIELVILARYHQILTSEFIENYKNKIINIHHSFLPAFVGKNPYAQAYEKGVKIIGATGHYVTEELDQGPIIEQDTVRINNREALSDIVAKGEDLEKIVLSRSVRWHLQRKVLCYDNKTVLFD